MDEVLRSLIEMASLDARMFELRKKLRKFPKRIDEARKQLDAEEKQLNEAEEPYKRLNEEIQQKEGTIKLALETIDKFEKHMDAVKTQKEYLAAKKQVEDARKLNDRLQEEILTARQQQEELQPRVEEVRERYNNVEAAFREEESHIVAEREEVEREMAELEGQLTAHAEKVGNNMLGYYQRLVKAGKVPAIVPVSNGTCTGCNMALPPQVYNQLMAKPGDLKTCSHCNRVIYYQPPEQAAVEGASAKA